jgi:hypothetical protein
MATMSKSSGTSDTLRSGAGYALSGDSGRALANAAQSWFAAAAEYQREMMSFVSMRLEKDAGDHPRDDGLQEPRGYDSHSIPLGRGYPPRLQCRDGQADDHLHQIRQLRSRPPTTNNGFQDPVRLRCRPPMYRGLHPLTTCLSGPGWRPPPSDRTFSRGSDDRTG